MGGESSSGGYSLAGGILTVNQVQSWISNTISKGVYTTAAESNDDTNSDGTNFDENPSDNSNGSEDE